MRLVTDIGGGSTEIILGQGSTPKALESLHIGCVSMTERFFPKGEITRAGFNKARIAARLELRPVKAFFRGTGGIEAIGTSGTILSVEAVARELELTETAITLNAVEALIDKVLAFGNVSELSLPGLSNRRAQVWPGGLSILAELFSTLRIDEMHISDGAVREGLLYDLLGRLQHEDARERTVAAMATRYQVDQDQANRVSRTAADIFSQCIEGWAFTSDLGEKMLDWAARLHEIGLDISHDGYQRHGAYIAENADMPGFPRAEQRLLAALIRGQGHSIEMARFNVLPRSWRKAGLRLLVVLRLAVLLNRSRSATDFPKLTMSMTDDSLAIHFDLNWLEENPLTIADLEREQEYLARVDFRLEITRLPKV
jgi:exopolyphosphatase/guanosine-5'-triphosphate,3'-diphosphate pyrophosphatase